VLIFCRHITTAAKAITPQELKKKKKIILHIFKKANLLLIVVKQSYEHEGKWNCEGCWVFIIALDGAACSASRNGRFAAVAKVQGSHRTEELVGSTIGPDDRGQKITPDSLVFKAATYLL
jgi:hypothetical protein